MSSDSRSAAFAFCLCWVAIECKGLVEWPLDLLERSTPQANGGVPLLDPPYHSAGYMKLNGTHDAKLFYFYFEERSRQKDAPLVFWTNGGPGCSSLFGLFFENGPYKVDMQTGELSVSEYGWDIGQNMLFVDQPVGVGFSTSSDDRDFAHFEKTVADDMLMFFWEFMEEHPEMKGRPLYLSGESYAGHYLPAIAKRIVEANAGNEGPKLNLQGIILGNPWTDPGIQGLSEIDFAEMHGLISSQFAASLRSHGDICIALVNSCTETLDRETCLRARHICYKYSRRPIMKENPFMDVYDIRRKCYEKDCYHINHIKSFLDSPEVQEKLGVKKEWVECSHTVHGQMKADMHVSVKSTFEFLLREAGLRTIIYVGDQDFACNWIGNQRWIRSMKLEGWTGKLKEWRVDGEIAGECETVEPLTYCTVFNAGHLVPYNKPKVALDMVHRFIGKKAFIQATTELEYGMDFPGIVRSSFSI
ncbi:hypothetical protein BSKO_09370 [Bryopsis sp. KO-2023]|nr:hypothetical protein BSKO_09370 [Bryopsis sp. KO-2023]